MLFQSLTKEEKMQTDLDRFLNRDSKGQFAIGNPGGPGRPKGAINKYSRIRQDILDIWDEENGKERFRFFFTRAENFERALAIVLSLCPKKWLELKKDLESGNITVEAEERSDG